MKLTIECKIFDIDDKYVDLRLYYSDGVKIYELRQTLHKDLCKDKQLMRRAIDSLFYELKLQVYKHHKIND